MDESGSPEDQETERHAMIEEIFAKLGELEGGEILGDETALEATFGNGIMDRVENTLSASIYPKDTGNYENRLTLEVPPQFWTEAIEPPEDADENQTSIGIGIDRNNVVRATFTEATSDWDHGGPWVQQHVPTKILNNQEIGIVRDTVGGYVERWKAENNPVE